MNSNYRKVNSVMYFADGSSKNYLKILQ